MLAMPSRHRPADVSYWLVFNVLCMLARFSGTSGYSFSMDRDRIARDTGYVMAPCAAFLERVLDNLILSGDETLDKVREIIGRTYSRGDRETL